MKYLKTMNVPITDLIESHKFWHFVFSPEILNKDKEKVIRYKY